MEPTDHLEAHEAEHLRTLTAAEAEGDERAVEAALRPRTLAEVVGQHRVREQLGLVLEAARNRGCPSKSASVDGRSADSAARSSGSVPDRTSAASSSSFS